jgi:hypothetical protein
MDPGSAAHRFVLRSIRGSHCGCCAIPGFKIQRASASTRDLIASASEAIHAATEEEARIASSRSLSSGAHPRDPLAPLRKRFAFAAGNDATDGERRRDPPSILDTCELHEFHHRARIRAVGYSAAPAMVL